MTASILIIDDEEYRQKWLTDILEKAGFTTRSALDANQALEQMHETKFDLAFFDHDLGYGDNGSQLATQIITHSKYKCPTAVWVHSQNWRGSQNIATKFRNVRVRVRVQDISSCMEYHENFIENVKSILAGEE